MKQTIFSTPAFATAWCRHFGGTPQHLSVGAGQPASAAVVTVGRTGLQSVYFAPEGFYGGFACTAEGEESAALVRLIDGVLEQLRGRRVRKLVWNVRFDQLSVATRLADLLGPGTESVTQVLQLSDDYEAVFANYNATIRNQVRKAKRTGVTVLEGGAADLDRYYQIHLRHVERRSGFDFVYPQAFLEQLIEPALGGRLLLAEVDGQLAAGGIFLPDGNSVYYFHSAYDPAYSKQYPTCAVIDRAIQGAIQRGAESFNMGGSAGIDSLTRFKSFWGAEARATWRFAWSNPLWSGLDGATQWIRKLTHTS